MERTEFAKYCLQKGIDADDESRPLTREGLQKTKKSAQGLVTALASFHEFKPKPVVISSPLLRARQTAEIMQGALKKSRRATVKRASIKTAGLQTETLIPGMDPKRFRDYLYTWKNSGRLSTLSHRPHPNTAVIAVGHEPQLSMSVGWWLTGNASARFPIKKSGVVCLEIGNAMQPGEARLLWALPPWALRALARG